MSLKRIISGFQTGADIGGILAAKRLGLETGGMMPKGFRTEDGPRLEFAELYGAKECDFSDYRVRTESNVLASEGTVVFGDAKSPGSKQTIKFCKNHSKPYVLIPAWKVYLELGPVGESVRNGFRDWLHANKIQTLNVAGNRESKCPGIREFVSDFLYDALSFERK